MKNHTYITPILQFSMIREHLHIKKFSIHSTSHYLQTSLNKKPKHFNPQKAQGLVQSELCPWPRHAWYFYALLSSEEVTLRLQNAHVWNAGLSLLIYWKGAYTKIKPDKKILLLLMNSFSSLVAKTVFSS